MFTGTVPHPDLPELLAAMDVAIVLAGRGEAFHYSPLKLAEYLAAGRGGRGAAGPATWPRGWTTASMRCSSAPGDHVELAGRVAPVRTTIRPTAWSAASARHAAVERWSWDDAIRRILARLGSPDPAAPSGT